MTLEEIKKTLETTGMPVVYLEWPENQAPDLPYICYLESGSNNFAADGGVYLPIKQIRVELYTKTKNQDAEDKVEKALSSFFWQKDSMSIKSEKCYLTTYEFEV